MQKPFVCDLVEYISKCPYYQKNLQIHRNHNQSTYHRLLRSRKNVKIHMEPQETPRLSNLKKQKQSLNTSPKQNSSIIAGLL